jgi:Tol biopolymer transport system component
MGQPSPDGRLLSFVDWDTGDLAIRDLTTGENRRLTNKGSWQESNEEAEESIFSPDGKRLAYIWFNKDKSYDLRLIGIDGSGLRVLYKNYVMPRDWSSDGKYILAESVKGPNQPIQIVLISVADGSARVLKTIPSFIPNVPAGDMSFSPDGRYIVYGTRSREGAEERDIFLLSIDGNLNVPLVQHPADDYVLGWAPDGKSILFASDRSKTIDAWLITVADGKPQGTPELVKRDIGRVWPLGFTQNGAFYSVLGVSKTSDLYIATLAPETAKLMGTPTFASLRFTGSNVGLNLSRDGRQLVYRSSGQIRGGATARDALYIQNLETGEHREVHTSLFRFSPPFWFPDGRHLLVRGVSTTSDPIGFYKIDTQTGETVRAVAEQKGDLKILPILAPDGKAVFYQSKGGLWRHNLETGEAKEIYHAPRPGSTTFTSVRPPATPRETEHFTANVAPSPDSQQLAFVFERSLLVIPATGGKLRELLNLKSSEMFVIPLTLAWTPDGRYLLFAKRQDKQYELWRIPAAGGEPQKLGSLMEGFRDLCVHPDGRRIMFSVDRGPGSQDEIWVMENFLPTTQTRKASVSRR